MTITRAMGIAEKVFEESEKKELKGLFKDVGWGVMGVDGGATGPLLGSVLITAIVGFRIVLNDE